MKKFIKYVLLTILFWALTLVCIGISLLGVLLSSGEYLYEIFFRALNLTVTSNYLLPELFTFLPILPMSVFFIAGYVFIVKAVRAFVDEKYE